MRYTNLKGINTIHFKEVRRLGEKKQSVAFCVVVFCSRRIEVVQSFGMLLFDDTIFPLLAVK